MLGALRDMALRTISLCSGIGGLDLGLDLGATRAGLGGSRTVCMVEGEAFAVATLAAQMERGALDAAPIWSDVRTFDARAWRGVVDCVTGGYPCQPFSSAGQRRGESDPRHLWPDVARVLRECGPAICFFENVSGHMSLGAHEVIGELQTLGYRVACSLWTAQEVGAPHRRERMFIMGLRERCVVPDAKSERQQASGIAGREGAQVAMPSGCGDDAADAHSIGLRHAERHRPEGAAVAGHDGAPEPLADAPRGHAPAGRWPVRGEVAFTGSCGSSLADTDGERVEKGGLRPGEGARHSGVDSPRDGGRTLSIGRGDWWEAEPDVGRVVNGVPARVDRLRALGNAVVPEQAARAFVELYGALA